MAKHRVRLKSVSIGEGMYLTHLGVAIKSDTYYVYIEKIDDLSYRQKADLLANYLELQEFIKAPKLARRFRSNRAKAEGEETVLKVINKICQEMGVTFAEVNTPNQKSLLVMVRQIIAYILSEKFRLTHSEIGRCFLHSRRKGFRDHSYSINSISRIKKLMSVDSDLKVKVNSLLNLNYDL
jgi:chromosomal replication initiation ATPase DnaA